MSEQDAALVEEAFELYAQIRQESLARMEYAAALLARVLTVAAGEDAT